MNNIIKRVWNQNRMTNIEDLSGMAFQAEDGGHTFEISGINDAGESVPLSGTVAGVFMRPDLADVAIVGSATDGVVSVTLPTDCYAVNGRFALTIFVTSDSQKVAVYAAVGTVTRTSGGAVAGDTTQDVVDLINAIEAAINSIPADLTNLMGAIAPTYSSSALYAKGTYAWYSGVLYKALVDISTAESFTAAHWAAVALADDVSELESTVSDTFNDLFVSTVGYIDITSQGYMNPSTGSTSSSDKYCRNAAAEMPGSGVYRVFPKTGYKVCVRNNTDSIEISDFTSSPFAFVAESGKSYRWCIGKTDGSDLLISNVPEDAVAWERLKTDASLSQTNKAADAKAAGDKLAENSKTIENVIDSLGEESLCIGNIDGISEFEAGAINGSGEDTNTSSYLKNSLRMGLYQGVRFAQKISSAVTQENATNYYHYINFYDISGAFISRAGGSKEATIEADVPSNAATFRVTLTAITNETYGSANVTSYTCKLLVDNGAYHASPKNVWYVLGDSISAGYYSMTASMAAAAGLTFDYTSNVTTEQGETTGSVYDQTLEHNYWGYANKWKLHRRIIRLARPGQGYFKKSSANKNGIDVVSDNGFSDAGLITVAWGFNDWHYDLTRGNHDLIDPSVPYPSEDFDVTQITTINQSIWYCLGTLIRKAPNAKIVVQTPMNGWAYGGDFASNWGIGTAKTNSGTLANIHDDIKYWADYYGLQVLEMTYNNSMINRLNIKTALIDGSHPSDATHQQLGRHVAEMLGYC